MAEKRGGGAHGLSGLSLSFKIAALITVTMFILGAIALYQFITTFKFELNEEVTRRGNAMALGVVDRSTNPILTNSIDVLKKIVREAKEQDSTVSHVFIKNDEGKVLAHTF